MKNFLKPAFPASITQPSSLSMLVVVKDSEFMGITILFLDEKVNVVAQIQSVQGSDLSKETTRIVIRLLIDP
ncbi:hypothetical protein HID58_006695 [Brassica napus]|uniref:Uncharacterized protein n=1 Tax=Brassica napus TaxID=3708 RepID=A0ABQ8EC85_BRANA|nr:hypothetical protein HID58_006695 [Brassica napus]